MNFRVQPYLLLSRPFPRLRSLLPALCVALTSSLAAFPGNLDTGFNPSVTGQVKAIAVQPDGKILIGGYFTYVGGVARNHIARLNANGTLDVDFVPGTASNPGADNGSVSAVAVLPSGKVLVGGNFTQFAGQTRYCTVILNPDGSLAPDTFYVNWIVYAFKTLPDGSFFVGGSFDQVSGNSCMGIGRIKADGTYDPDFTSPLSSYWGGHVNGIGVDSQGRILITGGTLSNGSITRQHIARLTPTGAFDTAFDAGIPSGTGVYCLEIDANDRLLISRDVSGPDPWERLINNGAVDPTFTSLTAHSAFGLALQADGKLLLGEGYHAPQQFPGIVRVGPDGGPAETAPDFDIGTGANSGVYAIAIQADGKILVGGNFDQFNGTQRMALARLENDAVTESLSVTGGERVEWLRGGAAPEVSGVSFELSTDNGGTWTMLGTGTRIPGGWELTGLNLQQPGKIRARGFTQMTGYSHTGSGSGIVEAQENFILPFPVPGSANLWLAGHPDGTTAEESDTAPSESPVLASVALVAGQDLQFVVTGGTHNGPVLPDPEDATGPDGGDAITHEAENSIARLRAPLNSLVGVFLNDDTPAGAAPPANTRFEDGHYDDLIVFPQLRQPFFIGNGLTSADEVQRVRVPAGATRLFLGSLDSFDNAGNAGAFTVAVNQVEPGDSPELDAPTEFNILRGNGIVPWTFTVLQPSTAAGITLRVEFTLDPDDPDSWEGLPEGSAMERDGDLWSLAVLSIPPGRRYFRVIAEAPGYTSSVVAYPNSFVIERQLVDTTPPTLTITHAWIQKIGGKITFRLMLDPRDETGFDPLHTIEFRSRLNTTAPVPATVEWEPMPWTRGVPVDLPFKCTACVIEVRARDAAGNVSPLRRRTFKTPFPFSNGPNLQPRFGGIVPFAESAVLCAGLFAAEFDGQGSGDDILQIDRVSGQVRIRRQGAGGVYTDNGFSLAPNSIDDSAIGDFNGDGKPDIVIVLQDTLKIFYNNGLDGEGALTFTETTPPGLGISGVTAVRHCAVGDFTGDGKPDLVISGTDTEGNTRLALLINYQDTGVLSTATTVVTPDGTGLGRVKAGDFNGDGWLDAVLVDPVNSQLVVFLNKKDQLLGGAAETDPDYQPRSVGTGPFSLPVPAEAIAVGDVTGDGRADVVAVLHWFAATGANPNDTRDHQLWQLFDAQPDGSLRLSPVPGGFAVLTVGQGPVTATPSTYLSDVLLQDMNGDRFPEIILTSQFQDPAQGGSRKGGVKVIRIEPQLDASNVLLSYNAFETVLATDAGNPHRLAAGFYGNRTRRDILLGNNSNPNLQWLLNSFTPLAKALDLVGGAATQSDPEGSELPNGALTFVEYPGGFIDYTLTYANNSVNALTNATVEISLPRTVSFQAGESDPGHSVSKSGKNQVIRWTETVPPGGAGVKNLRVLVAGTVKPGTVLAPRATFKGGGKSVSVLMPKVTIQEPLTFEFARVECSSDLSGKTARTQDSITWFLKATNKGSTPVLDSVITMAIPSGTVFDGPVQAIPGVVFDVPTISAKKITFTLPVLAPGASTDPLLRVSATVTTTNTRSRISATATLQRPAGKLLKLPVFHTEVEPPVQVEVTSDKTAGPGGIIICSPGEFIEYTVKLTNNGGSPLDQARVVNVIPLGTKLFGARVIAAGDNYTGPEEETAVLNLSTQNGDRPGYVRSDPPYLFWEFKNPIPAGQHRLMKFRVKVGADVPLVHQGSSLQIHNDRFNAVGFHSAAPAIAYQTAKDSAAGKVGAPVSALLPKNATPFGSSMSMAAGNEAVPSLNLRKHPVGRRDDTLPDDSLKYSELPSQKSGDKFIYYLIQSRSDSTDGVFSYMLRAENLGTAHATNLYLHDVLPPNVDFQGLISRNDALVGSLDLFHFYDAAGNEIPDFNPGKNHLVRSLDLYAGNLAPGAGVSFFYQVKIKGEPEAGTQIVSTSGGMDGLLAKTADGLQYKRKKGYHLTCQEMFFPVNGKPDIVTVETADAITTSFPVAPMLSRDELSGSEELEVCIPYAMEGSAGLTVTGSTMSFDIPKGYEVLGVRVLDDVPKVVNKWVKAGHIRPNTDTWPGDHTGGNTITVTVNAQGVSRVSIPLHDPANPGAGDFRIAGPLVHLRVNPSTVSALQNSATGATTKGLAFFPKISGGKYASASPFAGMPGPEGAGALPDVPAASTEAVCPVRTNTTVDTKVFVGRCAPMSVARGETFSYFIFSGNLTEVQTRGSALVMKIPAGCDFVSADYQVSNGISASGHETWLRPSVVKGVHKPAFRQVEWGLSGMEASEVVVVKLTVRVRTDFTGDSIVDDTCKLLIANAPDKTPGPLAVAIRKGNDVGAEAARITQQVVEGMGGQYTTKAGDIIARDFVMGRSASTIAFGAANFLHFKPNPNKANKSLSIIVLPRDRVFVIGHPDLVADYYTGSEGLRVLLDEPERDLKIVVGPGTVTRYLDGVVPDGVILHSPPGKPPGTYPVNQVLNELKNTNLSVISKEVASYYVTNSGNGTGIRSGTNNFSLSPNPTLDIARVSAADLLQPGVAVGNVTANVGVGRVLSHNGNAIVAAGGGNIVAGGGGNIVAAGGGNIVAAGGGNIVAGGGGNIVAAGGGNIVAAGGGNVLSHNGNAIVAAGGGNIVAAGGGNIVAAGGGNIVAAGGGNIVAGGGGNIVAAGGGNISPR